MLRSRALRFSLAGAGLLVLLLGAWTAWQVWQVNQDLSDAVRHAEAIEDAVETGDSAALDREVRSLQEASGDAADRSAGVTWGLLTTVPLLGDDADAVRLTSDVIDELASDGVEPLVDVAHRLDGMLPQDGVVDPQVPADLAAPVTRADAAFARAEARLAGQDPDRFVGRLDEQFTELRARVRVAADAMAAARLAATLLPDMLGAEEPQHYLLVFQNNAEIRGSGGLAGAASYIEADRGRLAIRRHVAGAELGEAPEPVLPLTPAEQELYGEALGTYFLNAGMTPDVARAADLLRARWQQRFPGDPVDAVLMVDAVAIGYLLDATGPITVDGIELTGDNVVAELLHDSYVRLPDPAAQDAFFAEVVAAAFGRFTTGVPDPEGLVRALTRATDERRLRLHSFDEVVQAELRGTAIAGGPGATAADEPRIDVTLNDTTGAKMSYFLRYEVAVTATSCVDGVQTYAAKARIRSTAPDDAATLPTYVTGGGNYGIEPGSQLVTVRIHAPAGGSLGRLEWNGAPMEMVRVDQEDREVGMTYVGLEPGQTVDLAWTMKGAAGQSGDTSVVVTPTIEKKDNARTLDSACASRENR